MRKAADTQGGIYTIQEAARFIGVDVAAARRWAFGYQRNGTWYDGVILNELPERDGSKAITFVELVELLFIRGFLKSGVKWPRIREAARVAARMFDTRHPFAMRRCFADPGGVYAQLIDESDGGAVLVELAGDGQIAMEAALHIYLDQLNFNVDDVAQRWHPLGSSEPVVLDPHMAFGSPVITGTGIRTATIAEMVGNDGTPVRDVAWMYDVEEWQVEAALRFESSLRPAA
jgi:uncharacterized protein (DUF433 family)